MPGPDDGLGKKAEQKIRDWCNRPDLAYSFDRIPDQMSGMKHSTNICDFICFKSPYLYYIESKSTWNPRFDFAVITDNQSNGLHDKNQIPYVFGLVIVLFATFKRAFIFNIDDIRNLQEQGTKSINIKKIDKWDLPYVEIRTIPSRKLLLDYDGMLEEYVLELEELRMTNENSN